MPAKKKAKQAKAASKQEQPKGRNQSKGKQAVKETPKSDPKRAGSATKVSSGVKKTKSDEEIVKVITKGGAAVDTLVPNKDAYRVLQDGGKTYSATLNQSNLGANNNKFYIIQVLLHESSGQIFNWNRWGRVGVPGQTALNGPMPKNNAINAYQSKYRDKAIKGGYKEIEIKYDDEKEQEKPAKGKGKEKKNQTKSKMDQGLQNLINLIFDINIMNNTMKEIGYDAKKMPLGRLGESTIKEAYDVLNKLSQAVKKKDKTLMTKLSGDFYTLIPHDFGFKNMANFILDNEEKVKNKLTMLSTISDLKITSKLIDQKTDDNESILDQRYKKLGCKITTLDPKS